MKGLGCLKPSLERLFVSIYVHFTSGLYKDAEEVKQEHWTARPDHTTKEDRMIDDSHDSTSSLICPAF